jgi:hypothetical protein
MHEDESSTCGLSAKSRFGPIGMPSINQVERWDDGSVLPDSLSKSLLYYFRVLSNDCVDDIANKHLPSTRPATTSTVQVPVCMNVYG